MKKIIKGLVALSLLLVPGFVFGVTEKEMDEARAIATKNYLRYANNGSGYLDDISVKSMAELENVLKPKEKENLKAFNAVKIPSDYASWNKDQLVEFWAGTAYNTAGLSEEGIKGRTRTRKQLQAMSISSGTTPEAEPQKTTTAENVNDDVSPLYPETDEMLQGELGETEQDALNALEQEAEDEQMQKEGSYTWVYIMVLAILVGVVVALIVFASNIMKKNARVAESRRSGDNNGGIDIETEERYKAALDDKDYEINMLSAKLEGANKQNNELKKKLELLGAEVSALRRQLNETKDTSEVDLKPRQDKQEYKEEKTTDIGEQREPSRSPVRTIYLGRANAKGIFVRADRNLNIGNTIYKLETTDGTSGTFTVVNNREVWEMALRLPKEYLSFGCIGPDLEDTAGMTAIINDTPGIAVVEGGYWKVSKKARIHYE